MQNPRPYDNLDPHRLLDAIEAVGLHPSGGLLALNSYENRVYQVGMEEGPPLIAKFYRPGRWSDEAIREDHTYSIELAEREIPVVPPLILQGETLHHVGEHRFALFTRQGGRALDFDNAEHMAWIGRFLGRLHAVGGLRRFKQRTNLDVATYGYAPYEYLLANHFIPESIKAEYCTTVTSILAQIEAQFAALAPLRTMRLHGDFHIGNILWNDAGPQIVDMDDCLNGPAIQDIWMLLTGHDKAHVEIQLQHILQGYTEFCDFDYQELQLIEALRTLRMIRYSGWLAARWEDPAFPLHFPWFNTFSYWREHLDDLKDQAMLMAGNDPASDDWQEEDD